MAIKKEKRNSTKKKSVKEVMKKQEKLADDIALAKKIQRKRFKEGSLKSFLIKEHATKVSNIPNIVNNGGMDGKELKNYTTFIRKMKYILPEFGTAALIWDKKEDEFVISECLSYQNFGTKIIYDLRIKISEFIKGETTYSVVKHYKVDPENLDKNSFVVEILGLSSTGTELSYKELNEILGYEVYGEPKKLSEPYIPATIILNDVKGNSEIHNLEEIFDLERQLLMEIRKDLDLSRKKIIYKTRLARKKKETLIVEMHNDSIIVFEDGDAIYTSPIDLWSPALAIKAISDCIDWLVSYVLKMTFASRDSLGTGTNKHTSEIQNMDQAPNSYLEDKLSSWSEVISKFFNKIFDKKEIEIELVPSKPIILQQTPEEPVTEKKPKKVKHE